MKTLEGDRNREYNEQSDDLLFKELQLVFRVGVAVVVGFPGSLVVKDAMQEMWIRSLGQYDPLEKEVATHSSILVWKIPRRERPGGLQSTGSQRA